MRRESSVSFIGKATGVVIRFREGNARFLKSGVPPAGTRLTLPRWGDVRFYYAAPSGFPELAAAEKISDLTCFSILINYEKQN